MVRLKAIAYAEADAVATGFNSTMVRLKAIKCPHCGESLNSFNSTMVRLKVAVGVRTRMLPSPFQFHNGSIKSIFARFANRLQLEFQFHNGSIKSWFGLLG